MRTFPSVYSSSLALWASGKHSSPWLSHMGASHSASVGTRVSVAHISLDTCLSWKVMYLPGVSVLLYWLWQFWLPLLYVDLPTLSLSHHSLRLQAPSTVPRTTPQGTHQGTCSRAAKNSTLLSCSAALQGNPGIFRPQGHQMVRRRPKAKYSTVLMSQLTQEDEWLWGEKVSAALVHGCGARQW